MNKDALFVFRLSAGWQKLRKYLLHGGCPVSASEIERKERITNQDYIAIALVSAHNRTKEICCGQILADTGEI
jgi:hypothetical protein